MKMRRFLLLVFGLLLIHGTVMAESSGYGVSFGYGEADSDIDIYRVGLKKDFEGHWFENSTGYLSGYFELSYNRWEHDDNDISGISKESFC